MQGGALLYRSDKVLRAKLPTTPLNLNEGALRAEIRSHNDGQAGHTFTTDHANLDVLPSCSIGND